MAMTVMLQMMMMAKNYVFHGDCDGDDDNDGYDIFLIYF